MKKNEKNFLKIKYSKIPIRIFLYKSKLKKREQLNKTNKNEPLSASVYKSYLLLIEELIKNDQKLMVHYEMFLNDLKNVFDRDQNNIGLNLSAIQKYLTKDFFGKYFRIENDKIINIKKIKTKDQINYAINDLDLDLIFTLFFYVLLGLSSKNQQMTFKNIRVCKVENCKSLYANKRKNICSDDCQDKFGNQEKSKIKYFKTYQFKRNISKIKIKKPKNRPKLL